MRTPILNKYSELPRNKFGREQGVQLFQKLFGPYNSVKPIVIPTGTIAINNSMPDLVSDQEDYMCVGFVDPIGNLSDVVSIIGKGVCFDAGGMDIKTNNHMMGMKYDKSGALIAMELGQQLKNSKTKKGFNIITPFVENLVSPTALMPDDILTYKLGKKDLRVEITDTDAEGRLILADGMLEAQARGSKTLITIATLTGHISYALGDEVVGILGNDNELNNKLKDVFTKHKVDSGVLDIRDQHRKTIKKPSNKKHADIINCALSGKAGAQTAAAFLENFVYKKGVRWIHLDIAGFTFSDKPPQIKKLIAPLLEFLKEL